VLLGLWGACGPGVASVVGVCDLLAGLEVVMSKVSDSPRAWEADGLLYGERVGLLMASADGMKAWQFALHMTKLAGEMARVLDGDWTTEGHGKARKEDPPGPPQAGGTVEENRGLESPLSMGEDPEVDSPAAGVGEEITDRNVCAPLPERKVMLEMLGRFCETNFLVKSEVSKAIKVNAGVARFEDLSDEQIFAALVTLGVVLN
jgi:hypothetical protein